MGKVPKSSLDRGFKELVRAMRQSGRSALSLLVEQMTTDKAVEGLSKSGDNVLKTSPSEADQTELQEALHGDGAERRPGGNSEARSCEGMPTEK